MIGIFLLIVRYLLQFVRIVIVIKEYFLILLIQIDFIFIQIKKIEKDKLPNFRFFIKEFKSIPQ